MSKLIPCWNMHYTKNMNGGVAAYLHVFLIPTRVLSKRMSSHADGFTSRKQLPVLQWVQEKSYWALVWSCGVQ
jgi:hypothetical protein